MANKPLILIDADAIAYRAASATERVYNWHAESPTRTVDENEAWELFTSSLDRIVKATGKAGKHADLILCFSCSTRNYFRHDIYPAYKGNRKGITRPLALNSVVHRAINNYEYMSYRNLEADDVMGIEATRHDGRVLIVSPDKDLLQIPGSHMHPYTFDKSAIDPVDAEFNLWFQALSGDSTDNYPGCPKIGKIKANKILSHAQKPEDFQVLALEAFANAGVSDEETEIQVNLARILHAHQYDFTTESPILWKHPNNRP